MKANDKKRTRILMVDDNSKKIQKKTIKCFMDIILLTKLRTASKSAYEMIVSIQKQFGVVVSSGTVYSHLYALERNKMICAVHIKGKRKYELTENGTQHLEISFNSIKKTLDILEQDNRL